jgi:hypothetical protein
MKRVIVFDCQSWSKVGDIGDNSQFYLPANVLREYVRDGVDLIDVQFEDGRVSKAHFKHTTHPLI